MKSYQSLLLDILYGGTLKPTRAVDPKTGRRLQAVSVFGRTWSHHLSEGFPLVTTKKVFFRGVVEELLWFLRGETNINSLREKGVKIWNEWAYDPDGEFGGRPDKLSEDERPGDVGPVYGFQWRKWPAPETLDMMTEDSEYVSDAVYAAAARTAPLTYPIDQLARVVETLRKNPNDRRLVVSAWNPADIDKMGLPPCHYAFQFGVTADHLPACAMEAHDEDVGSYAQWIEFWKKRAELPVCTCAAQTARGVWPQHRLNAIVHMRSTDAFLGLPFNIASYALLTHMVARVTGLAPGRLTFTFGDLHVYENHLDQVGVLLGRQPRQLPVLGLTPHAELDRFTADDIRIADYDPHPAIKADVGV